MDGPLLKIDGRINGVTFENILVNHAVTFDNVEVPLVGFIKWMDGLDGPKRCCKPAQQWMANNQARQLQWPSQPPELNPIENL